MENVEILKQPDGTVLVTFEYDSEKYEIRAFPLTTAEEAETEVVEAPAAEATDVVDAVSE